MTWSLHPIFESYTLVAIAALLMAAALLTPAYTKLSGRRRATLLFVRGLVIALLTVMMLRPTCVSTTTQPQARTLMVMFDQSRSMQLPDAASAGTRWQQQLELLNELQPILAKPAEAMDVRVFAFDKSLQSISLGQWQQLEPDGDQTDLGGASDQALRQLQGRRLVGVFVLSDGVQTAYDSTVDVHRAARQLGRDGVPLFTVPFGPPGDATQARDVALENLPEQLSGFVNNVLPLNGVVRVQGYVNQPLKVELTVEDAQGQQTPLGQTTVTATEDGQLLPVSMNFTPDTTGDYKLTMKVNKQDREMVTANNTLTCYVKVREGLKVAYLYGTVLGEQRALRWSLSSGNGVQLVTRFINPRGRDRWPLDHSDLLSSKEVDAFLLESVPAAAFRDEDLQTLAAQVAAGKGLMMLGGYYSFGPGGYQESPLKDTLPVTMGRFERQDVGLDKPLSKDLHWMPSEGVRMMPVADHPIMRLTPSAADNVDAWQRLPTLLGVNKLAPAKFAQVLAIAQNGQPVLISSQFGKGRVLAFAGDSTHRWWSRGLKEEHKRFWRQCVLWLVGRESPKGEVWIKLARRRFQPGDRVDIEGGAQNEAGEPIDAKFVIQLTDPQGAVVELPLRYESEGIVARTESLRAPGDYTVKLRATKDGRDLGMAESSFQVIDRDIELSTAAADHQQLTRLAMLTADAGGKMLGPEQLASTLSELLAKPPELEVDTETRWELGSNAKDAWMLLMGLTLLLSTEWFLRKRSGLV